MFEGKLMPAKALRLLTLAILSLLTTIGWAQSDQYYFKELAMEDGLSSNEVYCVVQDSRGMLWFGTDRGVVRYDYSSFKTYGMEDGLGNLLCVSIKLDTEGQPLVNCYQSGLFAYDSEKDRFVSTAYNYFFKENVRIHNWYIDEDKSLMVGESYGIYKVPFDTTALVDTLVTVSGEGGYLYCTSKAILHNRSGARNGKNIAVVQNGPVLEIKNGVVSFSAMIDSSQFYFTVFNKLYHYSLATQQLTPMNFPTRFVDTRWVNGRLVLCTDQGLLFMDKTYLKIEDWYFKKEVITDVLVDNEGVMWVTRHDLGVLKMIPRKGITLPVDQSVILDIEVVGQSVLAQNSKQMFSVRQNHLRKEIDLPDFTYRITHNDSVVVWSFNTALDIRTGKMDRYADPGFKKVAGGLTNGVFDSVVVDRNFSSFVIGRKYYSATKQKPKLNAIHTVVVGNSVYAVSNTQLYRVNYSIVNDSIEIREDKVLHHNIKVNVMKQVGDDLWYATDGAGLFRYSMSQDTIWSYLNNKDFPFVKINNIYATAERVILSTDEGVVLCKNNKGELSIVSTLNSYNGLSDNVVRDAVELNDTLYISTESGITIMPLANVYYKHTPPGLVILSVQDLSTKRIIRNEEKLKYDQNSLKVEFRSITNFAPIRIDRYHITLYQDNIKVADYLTDVHYAQFVKLSAGNYRVEIETRNASNVWSEPQIFYFSIDRHFTQTWWFISIIVFMAAGIVWSYVRQQGQRRIDELNIQRALQLNTIQAQEASLLLTNTRLQKFRSQVNPHFIANALNSIQQLFYDNRKEEANNYIAMFSRLLRKALRFSERSTIPVEEEITYLKEYLELEKLRFPDKFSYSVECGEEVQDQGYDIPPHLIQPLVENCIKHAFSTTDVGNIVIRLNLVKDNRFIRVVVEDDGLGMREKAEQGPFESKGLSLVREHLDLVNRYSGEETVFQFIDRKKANPEERGTRVVFEVYVG